MKYVKVYADLSGETHFEDVEVEMVPRVFAPPAAPVNVSAFATAKQCGFITVSPRWYGAAHCASPRSVFVFVAGEWEVTASDGEKRRFPTGSILWADDTTGKGHAAELLSNREGVLVVIQLAEQSAEAA